MCRKRLIINGLTGGEKQSRCKRKYRCGVREQRKEPGVGSRCEGAGVRFCFK